MHRVITLEFERSTKNTHRYREVGDKADHVVGVVYFQKSAFTGDPPKELKLTVEAAS